MVCTRGPGKRDSCGYRTRKLPRLVKLWTGSVDRDLHNFTLFYRIICGQSSRRPKRPTQVHIIWEPSKINIDQPAFVIHIKGVAPDHVVSVGWCRILDGVIPL